MRAAETRLASLMIPASIRVVKPKALPKFKGWQVWECVRRITCSIMNVSYVRDIRDADRACRIADRLCSLITEMAKEE